MLADRAIGGISSGRLDRTIHLPNAWRLSLLRFIVCEMPKWRDDTKRDTATEETKLTSQLCAYMNSATRMSLGWDFLQFRTEEPDEVTSGRKIDMIAAPIGTIWVGNQEYSRYATIMPIECKRLPTPAGSNRDEREYLFSAHSSTGGVQRFKEGYHGAAHSIGAMIGYIQEYDIAFWARKVQVWNAGIVAERVPNWSGHDEIRIERRDERRRSAVLKSIHSRKGDLPAIELHHLWIDMTAPVK